MSLGNKTLRVGTVPYLVARPLDAGLEEEPGVELVRDVPARLVEGLRGGELDVALVSSIELFRKPGYRYLAGLAVAGEGFVSSVQVFLRKPLAEVESLALDPASRAGAALTQVVLAEAPERAGTAPPAYLEVEPGADPREAAADAWLRIGDAALAETLGPEPPPAFNPSEAWREQTGLPFVFAVWIARPKIDLGPWVGAFARARERGASLLDELAAAEAARQNLPLEGCRRYLHEECRFELDPLRQAAALLGFRDRAAALELAAPEFTPAQVSLPPAGDRGARPRGD